VTPVGKSADPFASRKVNSLKIGYRLRKTLLFGVILKAVPVAVRLPSSWRWERSKSWGKRRSVGLFSGGAADLVAVETPRFLTLPGRWRGCLRVHLNGCPRLWLFLESATRMAVAVIDRRAARRYIENERLFDIQSL
jgi:hypothetical protein